MASSNNLAAMEPWMFRSSFPDTWISQSFARDNETLTKALMETVSPAIPIVGMELPAPAIGQFGSYTSGADLTVMNSKRMNSIPVKKKSRKSKRAATTFIMADPENFRQMVQEVTGGGQVLPTFAAPNLLKPEPQRLFNLMQGYLPTLDTSAFLLDEKLQSPAMDVSPPSSLINHSPAVNFDSFSCFPTLESWKVL